MKRSLWFILPVFLVLTAFSSKYVTQQGTSFDEGEDGIQWLSLQEAIDKNKEEPRMIFISFYTDWCGWCKKMDANTFTNPQIADLVDGNFYPVRFNAESDEVIILNDKEYKLNTEGRRPTHEIAIELATHKERLGYPTSVILDEDWTKLEVYQGYKTVDDMRDILEYYGVADNYKNMNWVEFIQGRPE